VPHLSIELQRRSGVRHLRAVEPNDPLCVDLLLDEQLQVRLIDARIMEGAHITAKLSEREHIFLAFAADVALLRLLLVPGLFLVTYIGRVGANGAPVVPNMPDGDFIASRMRWDKNNAVLY
jgi:hypothetical protein